MKNFIKEYGTISFFLNVTLLIAGMFGFLDYRIAILLAIIAGYRAGFIAHKRIAFDSTKTIENIHRHEDIVEKELKEIHLQLKKELNSD